MEKELFRRAFHYTVDLYNDNDSFISFKKLRIAVKSGAFTKDQLTPILDSAAVMDCFDAVELLLTNGVPFPTTRQFLKNYTLTWAARRGHLGAVKALVKAGARINGENYHPLSLAAAEGTLQVVQYLVQQGADIHACHDAALYEAVKRGDWEIIYFLVETGADVHARDDWALLWAKEKGDKKLEQYLLSAASPRV